MPDDEDQAIRKRVRELTSQVLAQGRVDPEAVRDVVRAVTGQGATGADSATSATSRASFAEIVRTLDEALVKSAGAAHVALLTLAARGDAFTDNDLKDALVALRRLEADYAALVTRLAEQMSGNLRQEMADLAVQAQHVGAEASARVAALMGEFAGRMGEGATSGLDSVRGAGVRMALLASGVLAGVADALRDRPAAGAAPQATAKDP